MERPITLDETTQLATGATAEVHAYGDGRVIKLFRSKADSHETELRASCVARDAGIATPALIYDELVEVGDQEGIIYERVDGPTMQQYLENHPERAEECGQTLAALHAQIHSCKVFELRELHEVLEWSIRNVDALDPTSRQEVEDILHDLPDGDALCHNDFYPQNLMLSDRGWLTIDWAVGFKGNPLADHARTWTIALLYLKLSSPADCEMWQHFWTAYFDEYGKLSKVFPDEFEQWKTVTAAVSLRWDPPQFSQIRLEFLRTALETTGEERT